MYTKEINKIALSSNYDKRIQTPEKITTYPYGMKLDNNISKNEMLRKRSELLRIEAQKLKEEPKKCGEETDRITAISRKFREESRRRRNETNKIIARSKKQLNDSTMLSELQKHRDEALRYRNEIIAFKNTPQPFNVENYQGKNLIFNCAFEI